MTKNRLILTVAAVLAMPGVMVMAQQSGTGAGTQQSGSTMNSMNGQTGKTHSKKHHHGHHHHHHKSKKSGTNGGSGGTSPQ